MATVFTLPDVGEGIHEGRILEWLVRAGETVGRDHPLVKVETDKAVVELPSPEAGIVSALHAPAGATIKVGDPLVTIGEGTPSPLGAAPPSPAPASVAEEERKTDVASEAPASLVLTRAPATPHTRNLARMLGVDIEKVKGTGPGGRITDEDVRAAHEAASAAAPAQGTPAPSGDEERVPMTHLRKVIARAMHESHQIAASVTHVDEADVTELDAWYREVKPSVEATGTRLTILPFFVRAATVVVRDHPLFNASIDEEHEQIILKRRIHVGIAVDTPEGLIVPVIRDADRKSITAIAREIHDLAARARERRLSLEEVRGATFTITNMGSAGGVFATPIIHQPEVAILGIHAIKERPVVYRGEIAIRKMVFLSLTFDHRLIDGAQAGRFMSDLVALVSNPKLLLARV